MATVEEVEKSIATRVIEGLLVGVLAAAILISVFTLIVWVPVAVFAPATGYTFWQLLPVGLIACLVAMWVAALFRGASKRVAEAVQKPSDTVLYMGGK